MFGSRFRVSAPGLIIAAVSLVMTSGMVLSQDRSSLRSDDESRSGHPSDVELADRASLTEKGRQLHSELLRLHRTRDGLGGSHPSLPMIDDKISRVRKMLLEWIDRSPDTVKSNGAGVSASTRRNARTQPGVEQNDEMMAVIAGLVRRIDKLERRIQKLEQAR